MYKIKLPLRYLLKRKISYLAIAAFALCVFIVVVVMTVHSGLVKQFKDKNHNFYSDCIISSESMVGFPYYEELIEKIESESYVKAAAPLIITIGSLSRKNYDENYAFDIYGVDPARLKKVTNFVDTLNYNRDNPDKAFTPIYKNQSSGFIFGAAVTMQRDKNGVYPYPFNVPVNEVVISCVPLTAKGAMQKADTDYLNKKTFSLTDYSQSNIARLDSRVAYIPFEQAQALCGMSGSVKRASAVFIKFNSGIDVELATSKIRSLFNDFKILNSQNQNSSLLESVTVQTWKQYRRQTIAWMEKEQIMLTVLFLMVAVTTVFIVFVIFYMIINNKMKDIGILRSVGVSSESVLCVFMNFAAMIALIGVVIGSLLSWLFLLFINDIEYLTQELFGFQVFDRSVFAIGQLPNKIPPMLLAVVFVAALLASLIGAFFPAIKAARQKPVNSLQVSHL